MFNGSLYLIPKVNASVVNITNVYITQNNQTNITTNIYNNTYQNITQLVNSTSIDYTYHNYTYINYTTYLNYSDGIVYNTSDIDSKITIINNQLGYYVLQSSLIGEIDSRINYANLSISSNESSDLGVSGWILIILCILSIVMSAISLYNTLGGGYENE